MVDHSQMKLGRLPVRKDERTLTLRNFFGDQLPKAPDAYDWSVGIPTWPMYLNDHLGDCTCACSGHMIEVWTKQVLGHAVAVQGDEILQAYEVVSGYNPVTGANDDGAVELDVLNAWRQGRIFADNPIKAFVSVTPNRTDLVQIGTWLFGGLYIGLALPITAQQQDIWDVVDAGNDSEPGSWGGHAVNVVAYNQKGLQVITWGQPKTMTWAFWHQYVEEAYAIIPTDYDSLGTKPLANGFQEVQLEKALEELQAA